MIRHTQLCKMPTFQIPSVLHDTVIDHETTIMLFDIAESLDPSYPSRHGSPRCRLFALWAQISPNHFAFKASLHRSTFSPFLKDFTMIELNYQ